MRAKGTRDEGDEMKGQRERDEGKEMKREEGDDWGGEHKPEVRGRGQRARQGSVNIATVKDEEVKGNNQMALSPDRVDS